MKKHLKNTDQTSSKFWAIEVEGNTHVVRYGRVGTKGTEKRKDFDSPELAMRAAEKLIQQKLKKGYVEEGGAVIDTPQFQTIGFSDVEALLEKAGDKVWIDLDEAQERELSFQLFDGDLCLDELSVSEAMIINGDLTVKGGLCDTQDSDFTLLVVLGKLKAAHLMTFSSMSILGDVDIEGIAYGNSSHDFGTYAGGNIRAQVIVEDGHLFSAKNGIFDVSLMVGQKYEDSTTGKRPMPLAEAYVLPKAVLNIDGTIDEKKLLARIRTGKELFTKERLAAIQKSLGGQKKEPPKLYDELLRFKKHMSKMALDEINIQALFEKFPKDPEESKKRFWDVFNVTADLTDILVHCHRPKELAQLLSGAVSIYGAFSLDSWPQWAKNKMRDMFVWWSWAAHAMGQPDEALPNLEKAKDIDGDWPLTHFISALVHEQQGKVQKAKEAMERAISTITVENSFQSSPLWLSLQAQYSKKYIYRGDVLSAREILPKFMEAREVVTHLQDGAVKGIEKYIEEKSKGSKNDTVPIAKDILDWFA